MRQEQEPWDAKKYKTIMQLLLEAQDYKEAEKQAHQALDQAKAMGDARATAKFSRLVGMALLHQEDYSHAEEYLTDALLKCQDIGDEQGMMDTLPPLGAAKENRDDHEGAQQCYRQGLDLAYKHNDLNLQGIMLNNMADAAAQEGQWDKAAELYSDAANRLSSNDPFYSAVAHMNLGRVLHHQGKLADAIRALEQAKKIFQNINHSQRVAQIEHMIDVIRQGKPE